MESLTERNPNKRRGEEQKRREVEKFNSRVETPNKREEKKEWGELVVPTYPPKPHLTFSIVLNQFNFNSPNTNPSL